MSARQIVVVGTGPLATIQDLGRPGRSDLGVGTSGAADRGALVVGNRLVGNPDGAAAVEVTSGGLVVRARGALLVAVTGASGPVGIRGPGGRRPAGLGCAVLVRDGEELAVGPPDRGLRSYLAVRGGVAVAPTLGSRSTDVLAGLGPPRLASGAVLEVGVPSGAVPALDVAPVSAPEVGEVTLHAVPGPRHDWFTDEALRLLFREPWEASAQSNRIGMRLIGPALDRAPGWVGEELPSEGVVRGSVQVPASGRPIVFLADHPVTGGYPVVAVLRDRDVDAAAQVRPGQHLRFRRWSVNMTLDGL